MHYYATFETGRPDPAPDEPAVWDIVIPDEARRACSPHMIMTAPAGDLICLSHVETLVSIAHVSLALCGTEDGCHGRWSCLAPSIDAITIADSEAKMALASPPHPELDFSTTYQCVETPLKYKSDPNIDQQYPATSLGK